MLSFPSLLPSASGGGKNCVDCMHGCSRHPQLLEPLMGRSFGTAIPFIVSSTNARKNNVMSEGVCHTVFSAEQLQFRLSKVPCVGAGRPNLRLALVPAVFGSIRALLRLLHRSMLGCLSNPFVEQQAPRSTLWCRLVAPAFGTRSCSLGHAPQSFAKTHLTSLLSANRFHVRYWYQT